MTDRLIGKEIGRYQILEQLGEGGMATVYRAMDPRLERYVAIKVIRREVFSPDEMETLLKRFEREAKSLGKLSHPNIVPVIDYGEFDGSPYLVMVYLPGGTLKSRLGVSIPWKEAVQTLLPIAHALEYVHDRNIIHRDIKPSNIMLTENGEPLLTDFGLVKMYGEKGKTTTSITESGAGLGTPDYMAPEQWIGEATAKSDMYSLGVVLYEMITGHRPYVADTPAGILLKQANDPLPLPTNYIPDLPRGIESVLLKVLAKDPENRYQDIHEFVDELERLMSGEPVRASTIKTKKLREQMTGTVERPSVPTPVPTITPIPPSQPRTQMPSAYVPTRAVAGPAARGKKNLVIPTILAMLLGGGILVAAIAGCWLLYSYPDIISVNFGAAPVTPSRAAAMPTAVPPTPTLPPPTETLAATATNAPPTRTPMPEEIKDDSGVPMRLVQAGKFTMGSNDSVDTASRPAHAVTLDAYYIDKFEVTNQMYADCDSPECREPRQHGSISRTAYFSSPFYNNYPVIYVDWWMARAYCAWRGARLPTEAEWEKAARGTDGRVFPWQSQERDCFYSNLSGCTNDTTQVDAYEAGRSPYGLYDMSGNVWEWTSSLFQPYPYDPDDGRESPTKTGKRVLRGGSFHMFGVKSGAARSDTRFDVDPSYYGAYVGFRCAKDIGQK